MVGWTMYPQGAVKVTKGTPQGLRVLEARSATFCPDCGTGLFYTNTEMLPGIIDIQSATYDDPDAVPARAHIQVAERIRWMERAHELPAFKRYPHESKPVRIGSGMTSESGHDQPTYGTSLYGLQRSKRGERPI